MSRFTSSSTSQPISLIIPTLVIHHSFTLSLQAQCLSVTANLLSGVVQGSGIGPVLFLVYIDELAKLLESHGIIVKLFADDVKVYLQIVNVSDTVMLQGALDLIVEWASTWQLQLSVSKCNMLTIDHVPFDVKYSVYDTVLPCHY